jgi:hypothetical protein
MYTHYRQRWYQPAGKVARSMRLPEHKVRDERGFLCVTS